MSGQKSKENFPRTTTTNKPQQYNLLLYDYLLNMPSKYRNDRYIYIYILTYETPEGRPSIDLTLYQLELCALHHKGLTFDQLAAYLLNSYGVTVNLRTLKRRFQNWGVSRRLPICVEERLKKRSEMNKMSRKDREESPIFEPEEGWGVQIQDDVDADAVMLSPPSTPASENRLPMCKKSRSAAVAIRTSLSKRPSVIKTKPSSFESNYDFGSNTSSNIVVSTKLCPVMTAPSIQPDLTTKILKELLDISPLSGDCSLIDEYINVLDELAAQDAASSARNRSIDELANEEATITLAIEGHPGRREAAFCRHCSSLC